MPERPSDPTAYEVLGLPRTAPAAEVRLAYRRLARRAHPDVGGTAEQFHRVQLAWEQIGSDSARAAYDAGLTAAADAPHPAWAAGTAPSRPTAEPSPGRWTSSDDAA